jgi:hypothetical protein
MAGGTVRDGALLVAVSLLAGCGTPTATSTGMGGVGGAQVTAVYSRAGKDYERHQKPDGSFEPETFIFRSGGNFGGPRTDKTIDTLNFEDVSRVISGPLAAQGYIPSEEDANARLLIMVYWGTTVVPDDVYPYSTRQSGVARARAEGEPYAVEKDLYFREARALAAAEAAEDGHIDANNANILGYTVEIFRTAPNDPQMVTLAQEVEQDRYYVVLLAYDYQLARRLKQHKLLWETRFSIPERGNDFEKAFPLMTSIASKYFGRDTQGLIHHNLGEGHVDIGEPRSLGTVPEK